MEYPRTILPKDAIVAEFQSDLSTLSAGTRGGGVAWKDDANAIVVRRFPEKSPAVDLRRRPVEEHTPAVLEVLPRGGIKAVFFDVGKNLKSAGALATTKVAAGHTLAKHTYCHAFLPGLAEATLEEQSTDTNQALVAAGTPDRIRTLFDAEATRKAILAALGDDLADGKKIGRDDRAFVFFAGHGATRKLPSGKAQGYIIPVDADAKKVQSQAITMTNFQDVSDAIPAKHTLFVMDACYSGLALTRGGALGGGTIAGSTGKGSLDSPQDK